MVNFTFVIAYTLDNTVGLFSEQRNYSFVIGFVCKDCTFVHFAFLRDLKQHGCQTLSPCAFYNMGFLFHLAATAVLFSPTLSFPSLLWLQIISVTSLTATGESWWVFTLSGYHSISCGFMQREHYLSHMPFILSLFLESHSHQILTHWGRGHLNCLNARSRGF